MLARARCGGSVGRSFGGLLFLLALLACGSLFSAPAALALPSSPSRYASPSPSPSSTPSESLDSRELEQDSNSEQSTSTRWQPVTMETVEPYLNSALVGIALIVFATSAVAGKVVVGRG